MRRIFWLSLLVLFILLATACGRGQAALTPDIAVERPLVVPKGTSTEEAGRSPTSNTSSEARSTRPAITITPDITPSPTFVLPPVTTEVSKTFQICSPLDIHPLNELPEIISDPYRPPPPGREERHHGVDFSYYRRGDRLTIQGVGVQAVFSGQIAAAIQDRFPYGNVVIVETRQNELPDAWISKLGMQPGESIYTLYAHLDQPPLLNLGEKVEACQSLGAVGKSGNTVEPHLHLEMRLGPAGQSFPSMAYYGAQDSKEERENYVRWRTGGEFRHFDPMSVLGKSETP